MTLDELRGDLRALLDDALPDLRSQRAPLQAERVACLVALPVTELEGAHELIAAELEARGTAEAADVLAAMARLHPEPLRSVAAAAAQRLGSASPAPALELRRVVLLEEPGVSVLAGDLRAADAAFAMSIVSDEDGLRGGLGDPATPEAVALALADLEGATDVHPRVAAEQVRSLLAQAAEVGVPADEGLILDGPLVVHALGLPPEAWPDLPLALPEEEAPGLPVVRERPREAPKRKAKRRSQKAARRRNR